MSKQKKAQKLRIPKNIIISSLAMLFEPLSLALWQTTLPTAPSVDLYDKWKNTTSVPRNRLLKLPNERWNSKGKISPLECTFFNGMQFTFWASRDNNNRISRYQYVEIYLHMVHIDLFHLCRSIQRKKKKKKGMNKHNFFK